MNNINIDSEKLAEEIEKLRNINKYFEDLFSQIKKNTEILRDYWDTRTSESVFTSFEEFYMAVENIKSNFQSDVKYLESVNNRYEAKEKGINSLIDKNIAM